MKRQVDAGGSIAAAVQGLFPGYYALVMATGIVSLATDMLGMALMARLLFVVNLVGYSILCLLNLARLFVYRPQLFADLTGHVRGPGFLTLVAATSILGGQFVVLRHDPATGLVLLILSGLFWFVLFYAILASLMVYEPKPDLQNGLDGGWLVAVVSTQSLAVLAAQLAPQAPADERLLFAALVLYLLGWGLYIVIISLIFYRLTFFTLTAQEFGPAYWISMGALAITTLAGANLIQDASFWPFLTDLLPFLKGLTLASWAIASWWIPLLLLLEIWRHVYKRFPIRYDATYWDIVFPLGMYTTCTLALAQALGLPFLVLVAHVFVYFALLAWGLTFAGLLIHLSKQCASVLTRTVLRENRDEQGPQRG